MELFAPVPRRIVNISRLVEEFFEDLLHKKSSTTCLTWSRITFGIRELKLQEICRKELFKYDRGEQKKYISGDKVEARL